MSSWDFWFSSSLSFSIAYKDVKPKLTPTEEQQLADVIESAIEDILKDLL